MQSVSKIVDYIRRIVSQNKVLAGLRVRGEVSSLNHHRGGQIYFDLKEGTDILKCIAWPSDATKLPSFKDGDEVIVGGTFGTYSQKSQYQIFVKSVELSGIGILFAKIEALKKQFRDEGLFDAARKRPLPEFPRRVAIVSSMSSKGITDFLATIRNRAPFLDVQFIETRVQGEGSQMDIGEAIDRASKLDVDVIVLTRGGGSAEDLFPFSLEPVVRAIVRAHHPVISAIGHEEDHPLSDDVADLRCETPSNAAQYFGQIADRFMSRIDRSYARITNGARMTASGCAQRFDQDYGSLLRSMRDLIRDQERRIGQLEKRLTAATPQGRLTQRRERLAKLEFQFRQAGTTSIQSAARRFDLLRARFEGTNPETPLSRGFAIVMYGGKAVRDAAAVPAGAQIEARVQRGRLQARVEKKVADG